MYQFYQVLRRIKNNTQTAPRVKKEEVILTENTKFQYYWEKNKQHATYTLK